MRVPIPDELIIAFLLASQPAEHTAIVGFIGLRTLAELTFGQVPCLIVNGEELVQSTTIVRFIAKAFDTTGHLYPSSPLIAARVDAIMDQINDMMQGWGPARYRERFGYTDAVGFTDEVAGKVQQAFIAEVLPRHFTYFESLLANMTTPWVAGTAEPTIADFMLAAQLKNLQGFLTSHGVALPPKLQALVEAVYALPSVVTFKAQESS